MSDYQRSIGRAVSRDIGRGSYFSEEAYQHMGHVAETLCRRMQTAVPATVPCEALAVLNIDFKYDGPAQAHIMITRLLLSMGWAVQQTAQFYDNFRNANPRMVDVRLARLFTREQLRKTYGNIYGETLADLLIEPRENPLLYAMLYGNIMEPVPMVFRTALVPLLLTDSDIRMRSNLEWLQRIAIPALGTKDFEGHYLDHPTAKKLYEVATDASLATSLTLSINDHGLNDTPKAQEAIRQAHRAGALRP